MKKNKSLKKIQRKLLEEKMEKLRSYDSVIRLIGRFFDVERFKQMAPDEDWDAYVIKSKENEKIQRDQYIAKLFGS